MQKDCNDYGFSYKVFVLETEIPPLDYWKERYYIETLGTNDPIVGYNDNDPHFTHTKYQWRYAEGTPKLNEKEGE